MASRRVVRAEETCVGVDGVVCSHVGRRARTWAEGNSGEASVLVVEVVADVVVEGVEEGWAYPLDGIGMPGT